MGRFTYPLYRHHCSFPVFFPPLSCFFHCASAEIRYSWQLPGLKGQSGRGRWSPNLFNTLCRWAAVCCLSTPFPRGHCWRWGRIQPCLIRTISQTWTLRFISIFHRCKTIRFLVCIWVNVLYGHRVAYIVNALFTGARGKILPGIFTGVMDFSKLNIIKRFSFKGGASHHPVLYSS